MQKDINILIKFIYTYCKHNHSEAVKSKFLSPYYTIDEEIHLCKECEALAAYAISRRIHCPLKSNKPSCKNCSIKCYSQEYKQNIRKVMEFSGIYFIKRGRIDYLIKYLV